MARIFEYGDYREFLRAWVLSRPKRGKGELTRLARALGVHSSLLSQVLAGSKSLSPEQAFGTARRCELDVEETRYFMALAQLEKSAQKEYRAWLRKEADELRKSRVSKSDGGGLSDRDQSIFYSSWYYSAVHLLSSLEDFGSPEKIAERLGLPIQVVRDVLDFLVAARLCELKDGRYSIGTRRTLLRGASVHLDRHLTNWRLLALDRLPRADGSQHFFSQQMSLSQADLDEFLAWIATLEQRLDRMVEKTKPEKVVCLNIDWFQV